MLCNPSSGKPVFNELVAKPKWDDKNRNELDCPTGAYANLISFQDFKDIERINTVSFSSFVNREKTTFAKH